VDVVRRRSCYLAREAESGAFAGVLVDTWQAFFDGRDANNPTEAVNSTTRFRPLSSLPSSPAVVIAAQHCQLATNVQRRDPAESVSAAGGRIH
jgi:hypothetical protein